MPDILGTVLAGAQLGLDAILVKPVRGFSSFTAHVTIKETHTDELTVTEQPVDQGANIADHAFVRAPELQIECAWSNSPPAGNILQGLQQAGTGTVAGFNAINTGNSPSQVRDVYDRLLALQRSRTLFSVYTGKRAYDNMLVTSLSVQTDKETENSLHVTAKFRQVLLATVQTRKLTSAPPSSQSDPATTSTLADKGQKQLTPASNLNSAAAQKAGIDAVSARVNSDYNSLLSTKVINF